MVESETKSSEMEKKENTEAGLASEPKQLTSKEIEKKKKKEEKIRMWQRDSRDRTVLQPTLAAAVDMLPTATYLDNPSTSFAAKFVHTSLNKNRCSINRVLCFVVAFEVVLYSGD